MVLICPPERYTYDVRYQITEENTVYAEPQNTEYSIKFWNFDETAVTFLKNTRVL